MCVEKFGVFCLHLRIVSKFSNTGLGHAIHIYNKNPFSFCLLNFQD